MAAPDLTDLATVHAVAGITAAVPATDAALALLITAISNFVPGVINRRILSATYNDFYKGSGKNKILLRQRPVTMINSINWAGSKNITQGDLILGTSGLATDGRHAILVNASIPYGVDVQVSYVAGYATIPPDMSLAVAELVAEAYARRTHIGEVTRSQAGQVTVSFDQKAMHHAIKGRLNNYVQGAPI